MTPDCLVLRLDELDIYNGVTVSVMYVFHDSKTDLFEIRGQQNDLGSEPCKYSFKAETEHELAEFLKYIMNTEHKMLETLYNCKILPEETEDITYDFFDKNIDNCQVIASKSFQKITTKRLTKVLGMVANVFNYY
jgi:hypothetical protein